MFKHPLTHLNMLQVIETHCNLSMGIMITLVGSNAKPSAFSYTLKCIYPGFGRPSSCLSPPAGPNLTPSNR